MTIKRDDDEMSMDDILASIRRYVADETSTEPMDKLSSSLDQGTAFPERESHQKAFFDESAPEVIHLTEKKESSNSFESSFAGINERDKHHDLKASHETLVSEKAQTISSNAFSRLAETARSSPASFKNSSFEGNNMTLDQLISELARPMIKQWLDTHLPSLVESLVNKEIERITHLNSRH